MCVCVMPGSAGDDVTVEGCSLVCQITGIPAGIRQPTCASLSEALTAVTSSITAWKHNSSLRHCVITKRRPYRRLRVNTSRAT